MIRSALRVAIGTSTLCVSAGAFAVYIDRPLADDTDDGSLTRIKESKFPEFMHNAARFVVLSGSSLLSKVYLGKLNDFTCNGEKKLLGAVEHRKPNQALITVSNHTSTVDDPSILACLLPLRVAMRPSYARWALCSQEYCYERGALIASFFFAGKTLPIRRGAGIDHVFLQSFHSKVQNGDWVHIFPEGKIDQSGEMHGRGVDTDIGRLKWGVGKLIAKTKDTPLVIPIYHTGMEQVMPQNKNHKLKNFLPRFGKKVYAIVGDPIDFSDLLRQLPPTTTNTWESNEAERKVYSAITKRIEDALLQLAEQTKEQMIVDNKEMDKERAARHQKRLLFEKR